MIIIKILLVTIHHRNRNVMRFFRVRAAFICAVRQRLLRVFCVPYRRRIKHTRREMNNSDEMTWSPCQ